MLASGPTQRMSGLSAKKCLEVVTRANLVSRWARHEDVVVREDAVKCDSGFGAF